MTKKDTSEVIVINLSEWMTQADKAREKGCSKQYISELIRNGKLKSRKIPELGLHLVQR